MPPPSPRRTLATRPPGDAVRKRRSPRQVNSEPKLTWPPVLPRHIAQLARSASLPARQAEHPSRGCDHRVSCGEGTDPRRPTRSEHYPGMGRRSTSHDPAAWHARDSCPLPATQPPVLPIIPPLAGEEANLDGIWHRSPAGLTTSVMGQLVELHSGGASRDCCDTPPACSCHLHAKL